MHRDHELPDLCRGSRNKVGRREAVPLHLANYIYTVIILEEA